MVRTLVMSLALATSGAAWADQISLSGLMGVPSGAVATASNLPVFSIVTPSNYGIGADRPGSFATNLIQFSGMAAFEHGIGMHSRESGFAEITFDLAAIAPLGQAVSSFSAYAGIDLPSGGSGRTQFQVLLDGVVKADVTLSATDSPALLSVNTLGASTLTLRTHSVIHNGAHSAFGDAMVVTSAVPEPGAALLFCGGLVGLALRQRRLRG